MRRFILIIIILASAFLVFRPAEQGYSRETSPAAIGAEKQMINRGNIVPTGTEANSRQQVNLSETVTYPDTDGDGCNDAEELGPYRMNGGERNPGKKDFFHFGPPNYPPGSAVDFMDIVRVAKRVGIRKGDKYYRPEFDVAKVGDYSDASIGPPPTKWVSVDLHK